MDAKDKIKVRKLMNDNYVKPVGDFPLVILDAVLTDYGCVVCLEDGRKLTLYKLTEGQQALKDSIEKEKAAKKAKAKAKAEEEAEAESDDQAEQRAIAKVKAQAEQNRIAQAKAEEEAKAKAKAEAKARRAKERAQNRKGK